MGGGFVSKDKFVSKHENTKGNPINSFLLYDRDHDVEWISGGSFPVTKSVLHWLKIIHVKVIVTLTIEPIKLGRNINHVPFDHDCTEWTDCDLTEEDLDGFELIHIPIADAMFPTPENAAKLLEVAQRCKEQKLRTYFHCWQGRGRTCTSVIYILMKLYNLNFDQAYSIVHWKYHSIKLTPAQCKFLKGEELNDTDMINTEPIIKTPSDHKCFTIDDVKDDSLPIVNNVPEVKVDAKIPEAKVNTTEDDIKFKQAVLRSLDDDKDPSYCDNGRIEIIKSLDKMMCNYRYGKVTFDHCDALIKDSVKKCPNIQGAIYMSSPVGFLSVIVEFDPRPNSYPLETFNLSNKLELVRFLDILKCKLYTPPDNGRQYIVGFNIGHYSEGYRLTHAREYGYESQYKRVHPDQYAKDIAYWERMKK